MASDPGHVHVLMQSVIFYEKVEASFCVKHLKTYLYLVAFQEIY
jgi:hypothetical protein